MFLKIMGAMPGYIYATDADSIYVNLFVGSHASIHMNRGPVVVRQTTRYPWNGRVRISVAPAQPDSFAVILRIPGWCSGESVTINGQRISSDRRVRGYLRIARRWQPEDVIEIDMPMPVRQMRAYPLVEADAGRVALTRGPLVYCVESADNHEAIRTVSMPVPAKFATEFSEELPGGVMMVKTTAVAKSDHDGDLYFPSGESGRGRFMPLTAIPYYANANRGPVDMTVWMPVDV